eukprot:3729418-Prymnesium_polylepis.1
MEDGKGRWRKGWERGGGGGQTVHAGVARHHPAFCTAHTRATPCGGAQTSAARIEREPHRGSPRRTTHQRPLRISAPRQRSLRLCRLPSSALSQRSLRHGPHISTPSALTPPSALTAARSLLCLGVDKDAAAFALHMVPRAGRGHRH